MLMLPFFVGRGGAPATAPAGEPVGLDEDPVNPNDDAYALLFKVPDWSQIRTQGGPGLPPPGGANSTAEAATLTPRGKAFSYGPVWWVQIDIGKGAGVRLVSRFVSWRNHGRG